MRNCPSLILKNLWENFQDCHFPIRTVTGLPKMGLKCNLQPEEKDGALDSARRGDCSPPSRGKHWWGHLKFPQTAGTRIHTLHWWEQPCHRTELNHLICVVHKARNSWVVSATLRSEPEHEGPRPVGAQSYLSLAAGQVLYLSCFTSCPSITSLCSCGARTSLLFMTCSQQESSIFASLERSSLCETLAQRKKLNLTFGLAFKSKFPDGLSRLKEI